MSTATRLATLEDLKEFLREPTGVERHDTSLGIALDSASDMVKDYCDRLFTRDDTTGSPSANERTYVADSKYKLYVRDFYSTTGLVVATDETDDGTYDTTWTITTDFVVGPSDQRGSVPDSEPWPWYTITAVGSKTFPTAGRRPRVSVTALHGWQAVPLVVRNTTLEIAADLWKRRDMIDGEIGIDGFSSPTVSRNPNRFLARLKKYRRHPVLVA